MVMLVSGLMWWCMMAGSGWMVWLLVMLVSWSWLMYRVSCVMM
jgi:hypothetical protein